MVVLNSTKESLRYLPFIGDMASLTSLGNPSITTGHKFEIWLPSLILACCSENYVILEDMTDMTSSYLRLIHRRYRWPQ